MSAVAPSPDPQNVPPPASLVSPTMQLGRNPMLPQHPLGAYTDSQYEAQDAILRNTVAKQYADLLQKLGYRDEQGNFILGSVESEANKQNSQLQHQQQLAAKGVTDDAQRNGILFSGMRGTLQARAEDPYVQQRADLAAATPLTIQQLYEQASGLTNDYVLGQNQQLAEAAARASAALTLHPPYTGSGTATGTDPNNNQPETAPAFPGSDSIAGLGGQHTGVQVGGLPTTLPDVAAAPVPPLTPAQQAAHAVMTGLIGRGTPT